MRIPSKDKKNESIQVDPFFLDYYYTSFLNLQESVSYTNIDGKKVLKDSNVKSILELLLFTSVKTSLQ